MAGTPHRVQARVESAQQLLQL